MLEGKIKTLTEITAQEQEKMFLLMCRHFDNCCPQRFSSDLAEKTGAILLYDQQENLCGFSTFLFYEFSFHKRQLTILFSGDTIIDKQYWGDSVLFKQFLKLLLSKMDQVPPESLYWFLISKGIRTYLLLPLFFKEFSPHYKNPPDPGMVALLHQLGYARFGDTFDSTRGVIRADDYYLCPELAEIPEEKLQNPHIRFFLSRNGNWRTGDELACLVKVSFKNFKPIVRRLLASVQVN